MSNTSVNILSPVLFYQNPIDALQTQNGSTQVNGVPSEIFSCRGCNQNLASNNPASQYQRQKLIQNTVRVYSSLYTMNLAGLSGYQKPSNTYQLVEQAGTPYYVPPGVYWNQMSDRASPSVQVSKVASGSGYHSSSTKHTITRQRPGAMSPGGVGVDIKHNSYDRYLNKLKGKAPLRRGIIPPNYGAPITYNRAFPVYGGKVVKTAIINGCDCPIATDNLNADKRIYGSESNSIQDRIFSVGYKFNVGDFVWAQNGSLNNLFYKAQIMNIQNEVYTIRFVSDSTILTTTADKLLIYFDCNCSNTSSIEESIVENQNNLDTISISIDAQNNLACTLLNLLAGSEIL